MLDFAQREKALEEKQGQRRAKKEVEFVEVDLPEERLAQHTHTPSPMVEVALPGGVVLRIFAPSRPCYYLHWLFERLPQATNQTVHTLTPAAYAARPAEQTEPPTAN